MNNLPLGNNKNINKKTHNRENHYENSQLIRKNNVEKARLAKKRIWKITDFKTCRQESRRGITLNQHKNHESKISRKPKISTNQLQDVSGSTASHAITTHDLHNVAHDVVTERHVEKVRPKKTLNTPHARCTTAIQRVKISNKKRGHLETNLPKVEVLIELRGWRRGRTKVLTELVRRRRGRQQIWSAEADGTKYFLTDKCWTANKNKTSDWRRTSDWRKANIARRKKKKKVSNPGNPTPCLSPAVNTECVLIDVRMISIGSTKIIRSSLDSEREMPRGRYAILSIGSTCNMRNPKACNVEFLFLAKQTIKTNDINRVPREVRRRCAWRKVRNKCA